MSGCCAAELVKSKDGGVARKRRALIAAIPEPTAMLLLGGLLLQTDSVLGVASAWEASATGVVLPGSSAESDSDESLCCDSVGDRAAPSAADGLLFDLLFGDRCCHSGARICEAFGELCFALGVVAICLRLRSQSTQLKPKTT